MKHRTECTKIGVAAIITDDLDRVLMTKRGRDPYKGYWHLPGGRVESYEGLHAALKRELREEIGVTVVILTPETSPVEIVRVIDPRKKRDVLMLLYRARIVRGTPKCLDATADVRFFTGTDITALSRKKDPVLRGTITSINRELGWKLAA